MNFLAESWWWVTPEELGALFNLFLAMLLMGAIALVVKFVWGELWG